jgi:hypothetical protein
MGPQGPGAGGIVFASNTSTELAAADRPVFNGYTYSASCTVTGTTSLSASAWLTVSSSAGQSYHLYGTRQSQTNDTGGFTTVVDNRHALSGKYLLGTPAVGGAIQRQYGDLILVDATGVAHSMSFRVSSNSATSMAANESRCMVEAVIVPST